MVGGRPSKYKSEYCDALLKHMADGSSFETFASECDVCVDTLYQWTKAHKEFSDAKKRATAKAMRFWENMGRAGTAGKIKGFNIAGWIYTMKCRFPTYWGEKHVVAHTIDKDENENSHIKQLSMIELLALVKTNLPGEKIEESVPQNLSQTFGEKPYLNTP